MNQLRAQVLVAAEYNRTEVADRIIANAKRQITIADTTPSSNPEDHRAERLGVLQEDWVEVEESDGFHMPMHE